MNNAIINIAKKLTTTNRIFELMESKENFLIGFNMLKKELKEKHNLKELELEIEIYYSGQGDSGEDCEIRHFTSNIPDLDLDFTIDVWDVTDVLDYDWYNNDGGYGTITLNFFNLTYDVIGEIRYYSSEIEQSEENVNLLNQLT